MKAVPPVVEVLKMMADASFININIINKYKNEMLRFETNTLGGEIKLKEINLDCSGFQKVAQCFYRELVDKTAYPDVTIPEVITSTNPSDNSTSREKKQKTGEKQKNLGEKMQQLKEKQDALGEKTQEIQNKFLNFYHSHKALVIIAAIIIFLLLFGKCE